MQQKPLSITNKNNLLNMFLDLINYSKCGKHFKKSFQVS